MVPGIGRSSVLEASLVLDLFAPVKRRAHQKMDLGGVLFSLLIRAFPFPALFSLFPFVCVLVLLFFLHFPFRLRS